MKMRSIFLTMLFFSSFLQTNQLYAIDSSDIGNFIYSAVQLTKEYGPTVIKLSPWIASVSFIGYRWLDMRFTLKGINSKLKTNGDNITGLRTEVGQLSDKINGMQTQLTQMQTDGASKNDIAGLEANLELAKGEREQVLSRIGGLENTLQTLVSGDEFGKLSEKVISLNTNVSSVQNGLKSLKALVESLNANSSIFEDNFNQFKEDFTAKLGSLQQQQQEQGASIQRIQTGQTQMLQKIGSIQTSQTQQGEVLDQVQDTLNSQGARLGNIEILLQQIAGNQQQTNRGIQEANRNIQYTGATMGVFAACALYPAAGGGIISQSTTLGASTDGVGQWSIPQSCSKQLLTQT